MSRTSGKILIVDDEKNLTLVLQAIVERAGYSTLAFNDSRQALQVIQGKGDLRQTELAAVITDLKMPEINGMELLEHCRVSRPGVPVVMITAFGTVESAVSALKHGAFDFVTKPFDQNDLVNVIRKAVSTYEQVEQEEPRHVNRMVGQSEALKQVLHMIDKVASTPTTVLIHGESGTGKELVARELHLQSQRSSKPFIKVNCGAIPENLIESELFGYEKGAFTGAVTSKPGRFELAHEGTLFLDEVGEMSLDMQVKLLRVLQEHEFERVGGVEPIKVDVRIITATNRDLEQEVQAGRFREDLYYRLNVVPIQVPSLRERREDIEALVKHFIDTYNEKFNLKIKGCEPECAQALRSFSWPGNIRQLENALERMVLMAEGETLKTRDLPPEVTRHFGLDTDESNEGPSGNLKDIVRKQTQVLERELIEKALGDTGGNVTHAAEKLGLSRKGLQLKIKELGLRRPE